MRIVTFGTRKLVNLDKSLYMRLVRIMAFTVQSVSAIAYPFDFRDFITITDASLYAIRSIFFLFSIYT